ncbi:MAG: 23S rRNA (guanosine(2251)-2'-O)-methyltransferase RlmB [Treponemataceae bacterium]|nr:23S rRNA (guanosine(2251)-2'-O)-methyltransferase RlmB [Treponemataceae bacterium]
MLIITGFHAIEEKVKSLDKNECKDALLMYDRPGPRVKKIIEIAKSNQIECQQVSKGQLDKAVSSLNEMARDHRGLVLQIAGQEMESSNIIDLDRLKSHLAAREKDRKAKRSIVVILDSITDPHNTGAIIRSCDQFGADLVVLPTHRAANDSEIIARASAGATSWVPLMFVPNLTRIIELLKEEGYWIYGADAGGESLDGFEPADKIAIVMGSEGSGMSRIVRENCDKILSIPTCGKLDSLNVSVAAGVLIYALSR